MPYNVSDDEAAFPLVRRQIYQDADAARTTTQKTIVTSAGIGQPDEKSKFTIKIYSGNTNEDIISLIVTIMQFKSWAEAKGLWDAPLAQAVPKLFEEWRKCLNGMAEQNWNEIMARVGNTTTRTFALFKVKMSEFIVKKVAHDDDVYFTQKDYLNERTLPANMTFNEYYDRLTLYSSYMPWLLDIPQIIRLHNIQATFEYERVQQATDLLWETGSLQPHDFVDIILRTMPPRWLRQFRLSGGSHQSSISDICTRMSIYDADDRRQRNTRYAPRQSTMRGGARRPPTNNRGRYMRDATNQQWRDAQHQQYQPARPNFTQSNQFSSNRAPAGAQRYGNSHGGGRGRFGRGGRNARGHGNGGRFHPDTPHSSNEHQYFQDTQLDTENEVYEDAIQQPEEQHDDQYWEDVQAQYYFEPEELTEYHDDQLHAIDDVGYSFEEGYTSDVEEDVRREYYDCDYQFEDESGDYRYYY